MDTSVIQWISIIVSILTLLGVGTAMTFFWKDLHQKKENEINIRSAEHEAAKRAERKSEMEEVFGPKFDELNNNFNTRMDKMESRIEDIDKTLTDDKEATVLELRVHMKNIRDAVKAGKELDAADKATWKELYKKYCKMGGNHFAEYVDGWGEEIGLTTSELQHLKSDAIMENVDEHGR